MRRQEGERSTATESHEMCQGTAALESSKLSAQGTSKNAPQRQRRMEGGTRGKKKNPPARRTRNMEAGNSTSTEMKKQTKEAREEGWRIDGSQGAAMATVNAPQPIPSDNSRRYSRSASRRSASVDDAFCAKQMSLAEVQPPTGTITADGPQTSLERRHALACICKDLLRQVGEGEPLIFPNPKATSLHPLSLVALASDCSPAAATTYSRSSRGRLIKELVATAEAELLSGSVLCHLACVHIGMWAEGRVTTEMGRGDSADAALDKTAMKLCLESCALSQDKQDYKQLIRTCSRWLTFVRAFTVGVLLIPPGQLGIKR